MIFLKRPFSIRGFIEFGSEYAKGTALKPKSRIDVNAKAGCADHATDLYNELISTENSTCPRELLRFDPPPTIGDCDKDKFNNITMLSNYVATLKFANVIN